MSTDDIRTRAAKHLLGGRDRIKAKAKALPPEQAARRWYGDDALDTVQEVMEADDVRLTDDLLAAIRDGDDDIEAELNAATTPPDGGPDGSNTGSGDGTDDADTPGNVMTAGEFVQERQDRRERLEADTTATDVTDTDADDIALKAMDGADRIEADARGQSPAEYVREKYGLTAADFDTADDLHNAILDQQGEGSNA